MEPTDRKVRYVIETKVMKVFQTGDMWFVHFQGSWESLAIGLEEPDMKAGDLVRITFEKVS